MVETKEEYCNMCSIPTPLAFSEENDDIDEGKVYKRYNNSMTLCNIIASIMIIFALYIIFVYKK